MSGWLPPGCTDKNIDDAAPGNDEDLDPDDVEMYQCDVCLRMFPPEKLTFIPAGALGNSAGCDTTACPTCCGKDEEE